MKHSRGEKAHCVFSLRVSEWGIVEQQALFFFSPEHINIDYKEKMYSKCFRNMEFVIDFRHFGAVERRNSGWLCVYVN